VINDLALEGDPVPADVRGGTRVELPNRDYLLHCGPVEAALATVGPGNRTGRAACGGAAPSCALSDLFGTARVRLGWS
jgi:hypothetical protein